MQSSGLLLSGLLLTFISLVTAKECLNATLIGPCICTYVNYFHTILDLDCSQVSDVDELKRIFREDFPNKGFRHFNMANSPLKILPADLFPTTAFGFNFKFETIDLSNSALEELEEGVFEKSTGSLLELNLSGSQLKSSTILAFDKFEVLWHLQLHGNMYTSLDPIESASIVDITLGSPLFEELPQFATWNMPALQSLDIFNSPKLDIPPNSFDSLEDLHYLSLVDVGLTGELTESMITWSPTTTEGSHAVGVNLDDNAITAVQPGAIQGSMRTFVSLRNNPLTALEESIWKPILDLGGSVDVGGVTSLPCGCDMAWAMREPKYLYHIYNGVCADGTHFINLNPNIFDDC